MRYITGSFVLLAVVLMLGCGGGPTSPSQTLRVSPSVANLAVGQTQVFTVDGVDPNFSISYYFSPTLNGSFYKVVYDRHADTFTVTYLKKNTITSSTLIVSSYSGGYKNEVQARAVINFK